MGSNSMDVGTILDELKSQCLQIEEAIRSLERLARDRVRGPGRGPGRPPGSGDPGPQPPPAAPAAARISTRLDRAVSGRKSPKATRGATPRDRCQQSISPARTTRR